MLNRLIYRFVITITVFTVGLAEVAYGQSVLFQETSNFMKYWKLRGRLIGDPDNRDIMHDQMHTSVHSGFMIVGDSQGMSIPAQTRQLMQGGIIDFYGGDCDNIPKSWLEAHDQRDGNPRKGIMKWGDTPIEMGHYLIALAFEWELLRRSGQSTYETEKELYYLLMALYRIDVKGEEKYGIAGSYNGFFYRDDIPYDFVEKHFSKNFDLGISAWECTAKDNQPHAECPALYSLNSVINTYPRMGAESYDQLIGVILGLAVVDKIIPTWVTFNGQNLRGITSSLADKMIDHANAWIAWVLTNPKNAFPVCRGAFAGALFSYPISVAGREITGDNTKFRDMYSQIVGRTFWGLIKRGYALNNWKNLYFGIPGGVAQLLGYSPTTLISLNQDNEHDTHKMFLQLCVASRTAGLVMPLVAYIDPEGKKLISAVSNDNHLELYDLLGSILIGYKPKTDHIWWRGNFSMLGCGCNCVQTVLDPSFKDCIHLSKTPSGGDLNGNPWTTHNRWEWFIKKYDTTKEVYEFAGIDYMEAYNAYRYKFFSGGYSQRLRYRFDAGAPLPSLCGPSWVGTFNNPIGMKAVFEIESRAKVYAAANHPSGQNGNLHFVVGSRIDLEPGFEVQDGARFDGRLGIYDCYPNYWSGYWGSYPCQATLAKGTADSIGQFTFYDPDTTVTIYNDEYNSTPDTIEYIDTTYITIDTVGDSIIIRLRECYDVTPDNEIVNICDSSGNKSGRLLSWHRVMSTFNHLSLYPNPARDAAYIEYYLYDPHIVSVTLFNTMGQDISYAIDKYDKDQSPGNYKIRINTLGLPPGVYYCRIRMSDQETVKKLNVY